MKKTLLIFVLIFTSANGYSQVDRISDMQKMGQAMKDIQSGFFYNNLDMVTIGANDLKNAISKLTPEKREFDINDPYEEWLSNNNIMTKRIQRKMILDADTIISRFSDGDAAQALQHYTKIAKQCMKCHVELRQW